jgi:DNA invertase Pin-like site-specific DNA recombinase
MMKYVKGVIDVTKGLAIIYDRASTEKQRENYTHQDVQRIGAELARRFGYQTEAAARFEVKSGEELENREVIMEILADIAAGKVAAIIVPNFTRLSRDEDNIDGLRIRKICRDHGVVVIDFKGKVYDFENDSDRDLSYFELWFASRDKRQIMNTMISGAKERARQGKYMGGPAPLGYKIVESEEVNKRGKLLFKCVIEPSEVGLVERIFRLYEKNSAMATARTLNVDGIRLPPRHKNRDGVKAPRAFTGTDIVRIVSNPLYCGWVRWGTHAHKYRPRSRYLKDYEGEKVFKSELQIIKQTQFDRVQRLVKERRTGPARSVNGQYPFSSVLRCRFCGGGMGANKGYKPDLPKYKRHFYRCTRHLENPTACSKANFTMANTVATGIIPLAARLIGEKVQLAKALAEAAVERSATGKDRKAEAEIRAEIQNVEEGLNRVVDSIADGTITREEASVKLDQLRERKSKRTMELQALQGNEGIEADLADAIKYVQDDLEGLLWKLFETDSRILGRILRLIFKRHGVAIEGYGEMERRRGRVLDFALQEEFQALGVVSTHSADRSLSSCGIRRRQSPALA